MFIIRTPIKILLALLAFIVSLAIGLAIAGVVLEDKIIASTIDQINQRLEVTLKVKEVKVSVFSGFPKVSVKMKRVEIIEGSLNTPSELETGLLSLDEITLKFSLLGLLTSKFQIDELVLKNGWINLYFDHSGKGNFDVFSESEGSGKSWLLDLDALKFENINLSYIDLKTGWIFKGYIDDAIIKGKFSNNLVLLNIKSSGIVGSMRQNNFYYLRNQRVNFNTEFLVSDEIVKIAKSEAYLGNTRVAIEGSLGREKGSPVSLAINGNELGVETLLSLLSQHNLSLPPDTKTKGTVAFSLNVEGQTKVDKPFSINLDFFTNNIELVFPKKPTLTIRNVQGNFNNGNLGRPESSEISISRLTIETGVSFLKGTLKIKNILSPLYHFKVDQSINVKDLLDWGLDIPVYKGQLKGDFEALGLLDNINSISLSAFENSKFYSTSTFSDIAFEQVGHIPDLQNLSGTVTINNQDITSGKLKGLLHGSNFEADFQVTNATAIVFGNKKAIVNTNITVESLNTQWLLADKQTTESVEGSESAWDRIHSISGDLFIDELVHNQFILRPFSANIYLKSDHFFCNSFLGRSCGGMFTGRFGANSPKDKDLVVSADINIDGVEVAELFYSFNNFDQDVVTSKNISGKLDGSFVFTTPIRNGEVLKSDFEGFSSLKVSDGRLSNIKQLESLSRFIALEELMDIRFNTIENDIRIENQKIIIPQMDIQSSAINLSISGTHSFAGDYIYRVQLMLSDVLFKKATNKKPENNQFGEVEGDGSGNTKLYIKLEGTKSSFNASYDGSRAREAFKQNLKQERENLKSILKDEFKFLRKSQETKDTLAPESKEKKTTPPKFKIEWDDE